MKPILSIIHEYVGTVTTRRTIEFQRKCWHHQNADDVDTCQRKRWKLKSHVYVIRDRMMNISVNTRVIQKIGSDCASSSDIYDMLDWFMIESSKCRSFIAVHVQRWKDYESRILWRGWWEKHEWLKWNIHKGEEIVTIRDKQTKRHKREAQDNQILEYIKEKQLKLVETLENNERGHTSEEYTGCLLYTSRCV